MADFVSLTLAVASCNLPGMFRVFQTRRQQGGSGTRKHETPARLDTQGFLDLVAMPPPFAEALPLTLADPENVPSPLYRQPLAWLWTATTEEIARQLPADSRTSWTLIPLQLPNRVAGLVSEGRDHLRISFCGRALYEWHDRHRADYTSPWSDRLDCGLTFWSYFPAESPLMDCLAQVPSVREEELATLQPLV